MQFSLKLNVLKGLALIAGKKDIRYYLNGVHFEISDNGCYLVATDGSKMAIWHDSSFKSSEKITGIIDRELIEQVAKAAPKTLNEIDLELTATHAYIKFNDNIYTKALIDGVFPDWRRVVPEKIDNQAANFNPDMLMEFKKAAALITDAKSAVVEIGFNGTGCSIVKINDPAFLGLIMPLRTSLDADKYSKPLWIDYQAPKSDLKVA